MDRKELLILFSLVTIFFGINLVNFIKRENLKKNYKVLIEDGRLQVSINNAGADELEDLPGIGPKLANRIIEYRKSNHGFKNLVDIKNVRGIGDKLFQKILPYIKL